MSNVKEQKCPSCGAPLRFDPSTGKLKCDWCESLYEIEEQKAETGGVSEAAKESVPQKPAEELAGLSVYNCRSCGAEIIADPETAALVCPYCGNSIVLTDKVSGGLTPDGILPFKIEPDKLPAAVRRFYKGKHLLPRGFFSDASIGEVQGVYVPFWLYDSKVSGQIVYNGERVRTFRRGDTEITETSHYSLYRDVTMNFEKVAVDASKRMDDELMDSIEPFSMEELKAFDVKYLSGYVADRFDVDPDDVKGRATLRMANTAVAITTERSTEGFLAVTRREDNLTAEDTGLHYVLLPVYIFNLEHGGKKYPFAVNGQTGKVVGELPTSGSAALLWFLKSFAIGFAAAFAAAMLLL